METSGTFEVLSWDEPTLSEVEGVAKVTAGHVKYGLHGGIEGEALVEYLTATRAVGTASFVGIHRVDGLLDGRKGTFVIREIGVYEDGVASGDRLIVPSTGGGDLAGITGEGKYHTEGHGGLYILRYEIG